MPPEFYPAELTDLSRRTMESFLDDYPEAILVGGWASWLRLGTLLSHDIDVVLESPMLQRVRDRLTVTESTHVGGRKYRALAPGGIKLDIYVPYQSVLGRRLQLPVENLLTHVEELQGRRVLSVAAHLVTKFAGLLDRPDSNPGEKDRSEIHGLLGLPSDRAEFVNLVRTCRAADGPGLVREGFDLLQDLQLSRDDRRSLRSVAAAYLAGFDRPAS